MTRGWLVAGMALLGCVTGTSPKVEVVAPEEKPTSQLILAMSEFAVQDGKVETQPAKALFVGLDGEKKGELLDAESNVFHKVVPWREGLLSIGGESARVVYWTEKDGNWSPQVLWSKHFGGTFNRMRDVEIGDVTGDGKAEIVVATHDQGIVAVLREVAPMQFEAEYLSESPNTFVHEIELGDLDGDGKLEIYATPSEPNRSGGSSQPGRVVGYSVGAEGSFTQVMDVRFADTHAKEILVADFQGRSRLFAVIEGVVADGGALNVPVRIVELVSDGAGQWKEVEVAQLMGERQSRFLTAADIDGDDAVELIATGMTTGLWVLDEGPKWTATLVDGTTRGFEQAILVADADGDQSSELYLVHEPSKGSRELRRYDWTGERFRRRTLVSLEGRGIVWGVGLVHAK